MGELFVGRTNELDWLGEVAAGVSAGVGGVVLVAGEQGVGKSSLLRAGLAGAADAGCKVFWGAADELGQKFPLHLMAECLDMVGGLEAAVAPANQAAGMLARDPVMAGMERVLAEVDRRCAQSPVVLVVEDLHWADETSLLVWSRLCQAAGQLPLLLAGSYRPGPGSGELARLRRGVLARRGTVIDLEPLPADEISEMVSGLVGGRPSRQLAKVIDRAGGNPLYTRELADGLVREGRIAVTRGVAELADQTALAGVPRSLAAAVADRLAALAQDAVEVLRWAAILGVEFAVPDLEVVSGRSVGALMGIVDLATSAAVLADAGPRLRFRHGIIRQVLYEGIPAALRAALHVEAARALADAGAGPERVATQLAAAASGSSGIAEPATAQGKERSGGGWSRAWLVRAAPVLAAQAPQLAADLLRRELAETPSGDEARDRLMAGFAQALLAAGDYAEAIRQASQALTGMTDPVRKAETCWVLVRAQVSVGRSDDGVVTLRQALASADLSPAWRARMLALLAMLERSALGDLDAANATAQQALTVGREAGDTFAMAHVLADIWLSHSIRRDHAAALDDIDQALQVLGDGPGHEDLHSFALDARIFTLQNLDQWGEAELTLQKAREYTARSGSPDRSTWATAAVLRYWLGQWDDALAELGPDDPDALGLTHSYLRERWSSLLAYGVAALVAGRQDQRSIADQQLRKGLALPIETLSDRENRDFLVAAHALSLEQAGDTGQAMRVLAGTLPRREGEMTLIHQWLPSLVRLAMAVGDDQTARLAAQACAAEAAAETRPARAAAASLRCQGLLAFDPDPLREAVAHYRTAGPPVELPAALEDLAAVLAKHGRDDEVRVTLKEAVSLYESFGAHWDIRRAGARLRQYGIRRASGTPRRHPASGWAALTPTEIRVAYLVADGRSNPDIAGELFLSRNTVQTHVSHILAKLGARSRAEIMREALLHPAAG
jgi:DNA-binding CsgD family transcriptional regulator